MKKTKKLNLSQSVPLDEYEQELDNFLKKGEFISDPNFEANKKMFEEAASRHTELQKNKSITLRVRQKDLIRVKAKAARNKIPYQTLIGLLIHKYAEGETKLTL